MAIKPSGPPSTPPRSTAANTRPARPDTPAYVGDRQPAIAYPHVPAAPSAGVSSNAGAQASQATQPQQQQHQQQPQQQPAYDPTSALASINHKIALLEEQTQGFVEINARTADEARRRVRGVPTEELEGQYIDLFQEMKRQERNHLKERGRLQREKVELEGTLARTTASRTKIEARTRDLALELKRLMDENRRLTSLFESARGEIEAIKEEFEAVRSEPALALGRLRLKGTSPAAGSPASSVAQHFVDGSNAGGSQAQRHPLTSPPVANEGTAGAQQTIGLTVVCKGRREHLHFILRPSELLQPLFDSWSSRFPPPLEPPPSLQTTSSSNAPTSSTSSGKRGMTNTNKHGSASLVDPTQPPIAPQSLGPPFLFTFAGRVLAGTDTPEAVGLEDGDGLVAIEIVDLARDPAAAKTATGPGGDESVVVGNPLTKAAKKNVQAVRAQLEAVFDDVVRERLKLVFRQYETRERQFEAVVRSKDLEILLARARAEQARALAGEAQELSDEVEELSLSLATLRCSQDDLLGKLVSLARAPTPEKAANLSTLIRDVVARQQAEATAATATATASPAAALTPATGIHAAPFGLPPWDSLTKPLRQNAEHRVLQEARQAKAKQDPHDDPDVE